MNKIIILCIILFASITRLIPHPPNFTPIIIIGLFGGAYLKDYRIALILPLLVMLCSDIFLGFHLITIWVYVSLFSISWIGILLKKHTTIINCVFATFIGSLLFFIVTNFGVWIMSEFYEKSLVGLITCYSMALPFFHNTIAGSLFYGAIMFGGYEILKNYYPKVMIDTLK